MTIATMLKPINSAYSKTAQTQLKRAESLMPRAATISTRMSKMLPTNATQYLLLAALFEKKLRK